MAKYRVGDRFGTRVLVAPVKNGGSWFVKCDCGANACVVLSRSNACQVCHGSGRLTHGFQRKQHPVYARWLSMVQRCHYEKSDSYRDYGGRGIEVCREWREDFNSYAEHVVALPSFPGFDALDSGWHLDRIDVNGNYEPGNVRWVTHEENMRNTRATAPLQTEIVELRARVEFLERYIFDLTGILPDCIVFG